MHCHHAEVQATKPEKLETILAQGMGEAWAPCMHFKKLQKTMHQLQAASASPGRQASAAEPLYCCRSCASHDSTAKAVSRASTRSQSVHPAAQLRSPGRCRRRCSAIARSELRAVIVKDLAPCAHTRSLAC